MHAVPLCALATALLFPAAAGAQTLFAVSYPYGAEVPNVPLSYLHEVNPATGVLDGGRPIMFQRQYAAGERPAAIGIAQAPDGRVYVLSLVVPYGRLGELWELDVRTATATYLFPLGGNYYEGDLACDNAGRLVGGVRYSEVPAGPPSLIFVSRQPGFWTWGNLTPYIVGPQGSSDINGLAFAGGTLYATFCASQEPDTLRTLDPATGAVLSSVPLSVDVGNTGGLAYRARTETLFMAARVGASSEIRFYTVDPTTGEATTIGTMGAVPVWALAFIRVCGTSDFNGDGDFGTDQDIEAFFACFGGNCCNGCGSADFNDDGDYGTDQDIEAFFRVLAGAAC